MSAETAGFAQHLALFGTASDVGKSVLATALCRLLSNAGYKVAPYKAQNMSNNAAVAHDGGEIGRAQYVQALAARVPASVHHNPVLLKPMSESRCQVVVRGQAPYASEARAYYQNAHTLRDVAHASLRQLCTQNDVVVLEGAGSCAEVNLRAREFVNFPAAAAANARVVLVADIERGGVFAQIIGSLEVMLPEDRARVCGVIVNKFRGDPRLFDDGVRYLEQRTSLPVLGVVPHLTGLDIDEEDSVALTQRLHARRTWHADSPRIAVLCYPHLANYTDFDALELESVRVDYLASASSLAGYDAVILPGSKAVATDLDWLRRTGLAQEVERYFEAGGKLLGVCGGLQMLGQHIEDPTGVETALGPSGEAKVTTGLSLLQLNTRFATQKIVRQCSGTSVPDNFTVMGYELHHGVSVHDYEPLFQLQPLQLERNPKLESAPVGSAGFGDTASCDDTYQDAAYDEGVRTDRIWGTYLHGLFDEPGFRHAFMRWIAPGNPASLNPARRVEVLDRAIERFAAHVQTHLDWSTMLQWVR